MTGLEPSSPEWDAFVSAINPYVPWIERVGGSDAVLNDTLDRSTRAFVLGAMEAVLGPLPDDLLLSLESLADASSWYAKLSETRVLPEHASQPDPLRTRRVHLRQIQTGDVPQLYASLTHPRQSYRWRYRGTTPSYEEFTRDLFGGVLCQFVVADNETGDLVGMVAAYRASLEQGTCYFAFARAGSPRQPVGDMFAGLGLFLGYLFRTWSLRKVYAEVPGVNWAFFESVEDVFFKVEGILTDYDFYDGHYRPMRIISIDRATIEGALDLWLPTL